MAALLWLEFYDSGNGTVVRLKRQEPPWRVIRSFPTGSGEALVHLHNVSGGVLDRDELHLRVEVGRDASAQLTTTGATRVYRSRSEDAIARQQIEITVDERGLLEYLPDPVIPFAQSRYGQSTRIELRDAATLFWWETIGPGREAAGEVFQYHALCNSVEVRACGRPVAVERFSIEPRIGNPASPARLGSFRYFSTFYVFQAGLSQEKWRALESELGNLAESLSRVDEVLWGVSTLVGSGLVVRGVGLKGQDLTQGLVNFWRVAKLSLCGRVAAVPRKIY